MNWDDIDYTRQQDLIAWFNTREEDLSDEDKQLLANLEASGRFYAWDCLFCGERCRHAVDITDEEWGHFQGVQQNDYVSFPGDDEIYTEVARIAMCDNCRMTRTETLPEGVPPVD